MSIGQIKDYTPNFSFIIPRFDIATWHDYMETNFRSIDALFYNLFGINNFKGQWKNATIYNANDVVFVGEDTDYSGRLVKVLVQHTTASTGNFTEFFTANPSYYELFADASTAQIFAQEAKNWAVKLDGPVKDGLYSSKYYANIVNALSTEITTLYNIKTDIQNVSMINSEVVGVSNIKTAVQNVANNSTNINTVANIETSVTNVANNINTINTINDNLSDINTVGDNISNVNTVSSISNNVSIVAGISSDVTAVVNNATNITTVANNITNVNEVNANKTNIDFIASNISDINTVSTNISYVNTAASNIEAIQVAPGYAARAAYSANSAQTSAELSAQYANDKINQTHITNCITKIPQDIKLALNNGTLTLKAGSKVCVPHGPGVYDFVTIANDINYRYTYAPSSDSSIMLFINQSGTAFVYSRLESSCLSGTNPSIVNYVNYYDPNVNMMYATSAGGVIDGYGFSFPIAKITQGSDGVTKSIDQVFNGFGYIGSTVFALPGVKGLIPNGRNADGSLKNTEFTVNTVQTFSRSNLNGYFCITDRGEINYDSLAWWIYDGDKNYFTHNGERIYFCHAINATTDSTGRITSFKPKTQFHAIDYNDKSTISGWGMPNSATRIALTLPASGGIIQAPKDGYLCIVIDAAAGSYLSVGVHYYQAGPNNGYIGGMVPMRKGDSYYVFYSNLLNVIIYEFRPCVGAD